MPVRPDESDSSIAGIAKQFVRHAKTRPVNAVTWALASAAAIAFLVNDTMEPAPLGAEVSTPASKQIAASAVSTGPHLAVRTDPGPEAVATLEGETCSGTKFVWESSTVGALEVPHGCKGDLYFAGTFRGSARVEFEGKACRAAYLDWDSKTKARVMVPIHCWYKLG